MIFHCIIAHIDPYTCGMPFAKKVLCDTFDHRAGFCGLFVFLGGRGWGPRWPPEPAFLPIRTLLQSPNIPYKQQFADTILKVMECWQASPFPTQWE